MMRAALALAWSPSTRYREALTIARTIEGVSERGAGRTRVVEVPVTAAEFDRLGRLLDIAAPWRATTLAADGRVLPTDAVHRLRDVIGCVAERERTGLGTFHCEGWSSHTVLAVPCRILHHAIPDRVRRDPPPAPRLPTLVAGLARAHLITLCPYLDQPAAVGALSRARRSHPDSRETVRRLLSSVDLSDG